MDFSPAWLRLTVHKAFKSSNVKRINMSINNSNLWSAAQQPTWQQMAEWLRTIGQFFVAFGTVLIQVGQWLYYIFFPQTH